jgi:Bifunctional DNA primase/polymerase, N-terminal
VSRPGPATRGVEAAVSYARLGISVIPIRPYDKRPAAAWAEYQQRRATAPEIRQWWAHRPDLNVGLVCGRVSSLGVVDVDPRNGGEASLAAYPAPAGPAVQTGSGGRHYYFTERGIAKIPGLLPGLDVQGEGSYVVAPPSIHPNGVRYCWLPGRALGEAPLPAAPFWLRRLIQRHQGSPPAAAGDPGDGAPLALAELLASLEGVRRAGAGWLAKCPAHHDVEPSLSIGTGTKRAVLLHCHAGCPYPTIRAALAQRGATCP